MSASPATDTPRLLELERLRAAIGAQRERVAELQREAQQSARRVTVAREQLESFYRVRERRRAGAVDVDPNGDPLPEPGEATEEELIAKVKKAEGGLSLRPAVKSFGRGDIDVELLVADPKAEATLLEAREILAEREGELRIFVQSHLDDFAVERAPQARQVAERAERALAVAAEASGAFEAERSWWVTVLAQTVGEGETALIDLPGNPFEGLAQGQVVAPPLPERFLKKEGAAMDA